ncbi:putative O-methyltransferase YrrM [Agrobacterium larrymoorei]|uniref:O-methyltransferase YrrM n=1 Tax=Agrobacterium larrymoorei TaxID=160699 RepID=A0AAJ2BJV9_9HYPH|nr:class I SAM-dependent methyltransferase [Agrobacterium larrymoorei]MDR6100985.1 putative O-methyltransferase YrrM [Agrobacterium larrymoorei]
MGLRRELRKQIARFNEMFRCQASEALLTEIADIRQKVSQLHNEFDNNNGDVRFILDELRGLSRHSLLAKNHESHNLLGMADLLAGLESAQYYTDNFPLALTFNDGLDLLIDAVRRAKDDGLFLEFGVASGRTARCISEHIDGTLYAFDVFEGLPEDWRTGYMKGHFAGVAPELHDNVVIVKGLFADTLPKFAAENDGFISFLHIDCDLYSSTKEIFNIIGRRLVPGSVIVFDEYFNYPGWKRHEFLAFKEFTEANGVEYSYVSFVPSHQQVCVVIRKVSWQVDNGYDFLSSNPGETVRSSEKPVSHQHTNNYP